MRCGGRTRRRGGIEAILPPYNGKVSGRRRLTRALLWAAIAAAVARPAGAALDFKWTRRADMSLFRYAPGVASVNNLVYIFGGEDCPGACVNLSSVVTYNPVSNTYLAKRDMPTARHAMAVGVINGIIHLAGGYLDGPGGGPYASHEAYNPFFNTWSAPAPLPTARGAAGGAVVNGKFYAIGGWDDAAALSNNDMYDPLTNAWTPRAPMFTPRLLWGASVVNGIVYAIGGADGFFQSVGDVESYDPVADAWTTRASMPAPRGWMSTVVLDNRIYAIGGVDGLGLAVETVEEYSPATDTWVPKAGLQFARMGTGAAAVNGRAYVFGGSGWFISEEGTLAASCDSPKLAWSVTYAATGSPSDVARGVAVLGGTAYVAGWETRTDLAQGLDVRLSAYSPSGALLWTVSFNGAGNGDDAAMAVAVDVSGSVVIAGREDRTADGQGWDWLVRKYDGDGALLWSRTFGSPAAGQDEALGVAVDANGTAYVVGFESRTDLGQEADWMIRALGPDGADVWSLPFAGFGSSSDFARSVAVDANGDILVAGDEGVDWRVAKVAPDGTELWALPYDASANDHAYGVAANSLDEAVVAGIENVTGQSTNWRVRAYPPGGGSPVWTQTYNDPVNSLDNAFAVAVDAADRVVVAGSERRADKFTYHNWKLKGFTAAGATTWERDADFALADDFAYGVAVDRVSGDIYAAGSFRSGTAVVWGVRKYVRTACLDAAIDFGSPQPATGQIFTVALTVTNNGEAAALAVSPTLLVDSGTQFVALASGPSPGLPVTLAPGASQTFLYSYVVGAAGTMAFSGGALGTDAGLGTPVDSPAKAFLTTFPPALLVPSFTVTPDPVLVGGRLTAVLTVANTGTLAALSLAPTIFVSSSGSLVAPLTGPVPSGTVSVAAGSSQAFTWTFSATAGGPVTFTATAGGEDVNGESVVATPPPRTVVITPLRVTVAASPSVGMVGAWEEARVTVENVAPYAVTGLAVSVSVTAGLGFVSERVTGAASGLTLAAGASRVFTWRYNAEDAGDVTFTASASGTDGSSGNPVAGSGAATVTIRAPVLRVYPVPFNPGTAVRGTVKFEGLYEGAVICIYTVSGRLVWEGGMTGGPVEWDGRNQEREPVEPGVYLWVADNRSRGKQTGKMILVR